MSWIALSTVAVSSTIYVSSSNRINIDDVGVMIWEEQSHETVEISHMARALIDSSTCAEETYSSGCSSSDPEGCPCTAFTDAEKQQILDLHNERRELAAAGEEICSNSDGSGTEKCPAATDMNALLWDDQLETISTYWAHQLMINLQTVITVHNLNLLEQSFYKIPNVLMILFCESMIRCIWDHHSNQLGDEQQDQYETLCDANGCLAYGYTTGYFIGENMAASGTSGTASWSMTKILSGIESWYDESQDYYWDTQTSYGVTGHWTAGVWAKSRYIGCGYANCDFNSPWDDYGASNWINFVCKMYPGGNYGSGDPYTTGTKCSDCEDDRITCSGDNSALCDGGMCLNCAVDYFQSDCGYTPTTCPSTMYYGDGITESAPSSTMIEITSDPDCSYGILAANNEVCCSAADCTQCGGSGCAAAGTACCSGTVRALGLSCDSNVAPCLVTVTTTTATPTTENPTSQYTPVPTTLTSDPSCSYGILAPNNEVCCSAADCTQCGGSGCAAAGTACCSGTVRALALSCDSNVAPCVIYSGDYDCSEGLTNSGETVCCPTSCGACGGSGCANNPGGASDCCAGTISSSGVSCDDYDAPCVLSDAYTNNAFGTFFWVAMERMRETENPLMTILVLVLVFLLGSFCVANVVVRGAMCCLNKCCDCKRSQKRQKYAKVKVESEASETEIESDVDEAKGLVWWLA